MSADTEHSINWLITRKSGDDTEYLVSATPTWKTDKRFAKIFDTKAGARKYLKSTGEKGTVRKSD
tara:strand:- start:119 stop:313 length:195 start_codon:yes stop_codon:yes gene_type:complete